MDLECRASKSFSRSQRFTLIPSVVVHYNSMGPLVLSCGTLPYRMGAILLHIIDNNTERLVVFASRTLSKIETNYAHLEKEALYIIFGNQKFHNYLYGRKLIVYSKHKPPMYMFNVSKAIPVMKSPTESYTSHWHLVHTTMKYVTDQANSKLMLMH